MSWMPLEPIGEGLGGLLETLPRGPSRVAPPRVEKREGTRKREEETRDKREEKREERRDKREEREGIREKRQERREKREEEKRGGRRED